MPYIRAIKMIACASVLIAGLAVFGAPSASVVPTRPAAPTGCATNVFSLEIESHPAWGVVPFDALLRVTLRSSTDSVVSVWWDFESDGTVDASGLSVRHTFGQPVDYRVAATVTTAERGGFELAGTVSGYVAVMSLTFDDGCKSVYSQAMPILNSRGLTGTAYIIPTWVKDWGSTYMSWSDIRELADLGWDIGSHTMTHVSLKGVDDSTLHYELYAAKEELQSRGFEAGNFSFPFGQYDQAALDAVKVCHESSRMVGHALNPPVEFTDPYSLLSKTSQPWIALEQYQADVDSVAAYGGWYILNNHRVWPDCYSTSLCIQCQMMADLVDYTVDSRLKVANVEEVLGYRRASEENSRMPRDDHEDEAGSHAILWTYSNPFRPPAEIEFRLASPASAVAQIYDCIGRLVKNLECGPGERSIHTISWDGLNSLGEPVASGVYYCAVTIKGRAHATSPILILR